MPRQFPLRVRTASRSSCSQSSRMAVLPMSSAVEGDTRLSANLPEPIMVNAYGNTVPLNQVAGINVPEPRLITVQVWDRGVVKAVDKAIRESGLDLNPQTEGQTIRVPIPDLNEERRRSLTRVAAKYAEDTRVSVRNVRR